MPDGELSCAEVAAMLSLVASEPPPANVVIVVPVGSDLRMRCAPLSAQ
jgi:hypothetical protein